MANGTLSAVLAIAVAAMPASSLAMSAQRPCNLEGAEKLPAVTGGASAVCSAIEQAIADRAPMLEYRAEVLVISKSSLKATVTAEGRTLAQEQLSIMDRNLNPQSIERFANRLADEVARSAKA